MKKYINVITLITILFFSAVIIQMLIRKEQFDIPNVLLLIWITNIAYINGYIGGQKKC